MDKLVSVKMSNVEEVLLSDGWYGVLAGTFDIGEIAFLRDDNAIEGPGTGQRAQSLQWIDRLSRMQITCPLSAVQAIKAKAN